MKQFFLLICIVTLGTATTQAQQYKLNSPDNRYVVELTTRPDLSFSVYKENNLILAATHISMTLQNGKVLGKSSSVKKKSFTSVDETITPIVPVKNKTIPNKYNQLTVQFKDGYSIVFRAYNDAVAYRFETTMGNKIIVANEQFDPQFPAGSEAWFSYLEGKDTLPDRWMTSYEKNYKKVSLADWQGKRPAELPILVSIPEGEKVLITESDLRDYPGLYLQQGDGNTLKSIFPPKVKTNHNNKKGEPNWDRTLRPESVYNYIAETDGTRAFPWRILGLAEKDIDLLNNEIVYKLAEPSKFNETGWIQPGLVAWDWWNDWNISHVDFKSGINTDTYKYYIDFASEYHLPFIIMDDGWYELGDLTKVNPNLDMHELTQYAASKNVGIILWASWLTLNNQMEEALNLFQKWGIKGIKVDFMDRDDQDVVNFYWRCAEEAAKRHLTVDYHGSHKPTGLNRVYPNVVNFEGVAGLEQSKWGKDANPGMAVSIPFIRMFTGPMDYTPGAMRNQTKRDFHPTYSMPTSQSTRAQQLAMYIIYDAPLQMLSDNPTAYMKEEESIQFLASMPTTWDETIPLLGKVGEYVALARKKDQEYFVGAMSNWNARDITVDFSFLPAGDWHIEYFKDGINANKDATDYKRETTTVTNKDTMKVHLAPGGGFAARIY